MGNGYVGSNGGPYKHGKVFCGFCGEFRREDGVFTNHAGKLKCVTCGLMIRTRSRHWTQTAEPHKQPKRY